jgi:hypothetical protein
VATARTAELIRSTDGSASPAVVFVGRQIERFVDQAIAVLVEPVAARLIGKCGGREAGDRTVGALSQAVAATAEVGERDAEQPRTGDVIDREIAVVVCARVGAALRGRRDRALARSECAADTVLRACVAATDACGQERTRVAALALSAAARTAVVHLAVAVFVSGLPVAADLRARLHEAGTGLQYAVLAQLLALRAGADACEAAVALLRASGHAFWVARHVGVVVDLSVAVVIETVANLWRRLGLGDAGLSSTRAAQRAGGAAARARGLTRPERDLLVDLAVAVVVEPVA